MTYLVGRDGTPDGRPSAHLGSYRALDGSTGARIHLDLDGPHAIAIVGKRGYGKSYTMGVIAEGLARADGVAPVIVDPMGAFGTLVEPAEGDPVPAEAIDEPRVAPDALDPRSWCALVDLSPESAAGSLVWQAARAETTIPEMCDHVEGADASPTATRAAINHLELAASWDVLDATGLTAADLSGPAVSVLDVSGLDAAPANAVVRGVAESLYRARVDGAMTRLPWLLVDEAHAFFDDVAQPALERILTRGRAPGVSLVLATQRPSVLPPVAISQSDVLVAHRLTSGADVDALEAAQPTYLRESVDDRLPTETGEVLVVDDATESVHVAAVRSRDTPHGGGSPRASAASVQDGAPTDGLESAEETGP